MNETEKTTFSVPSPGELEQLTELHKAMGDYTRMRILWYLMQKDSCVSELAQKMEVTESFCLAFPLPDSRQTKSNILFATNCVLSDAVFFPPHTYRLTIL